MNLNKGVVVLSRTISVLGFSAVAGEKEHSGPLGGKFDKVFYGKHSGERTFERAESKMQLCAAKNAIRKSNLDVSQIDVAFAGDLLNQCIGSTYGLCSLNIPFIGLYGACSTMAESILVASIFLNSNSVSTALAVTASHFCATERQFRFPLEYGGQRTLSAQWTATAAGAVVLSNSFLNNKIQIKAVCVGKIVDFNVKDINNMGAAMAPAAADTIARFFRATKTQAQDFDLILTGDLGAIGTKLFYKLMENYGYSLNGRHNDCGLMLFDRIKQDVHAGGSGCGCSAAVLCADVLNRMQNGELKKVLFVATGALMSKLSINQGESIPAVAHLIYLESE